MKRLFERLFLVLIFALSTQTFAQVAGTADSREADYLHRALKQVTDVIVHDIYSPPVASRIYAYSTIAAYEAAINSNPQYISLAGQIRSLSPVPKPEPGIEYNFNLSAIQAMLQVARTMVNSEHQIDTFRNKFIAELRSQPMADDVFNRSVAFGNKIAQHILAWAATDNYKQTRGMARYYLSNDEAAWKPTPPAYMKAVEPHWNKMRTFVIDSAQQFTPDRPVPFSTNKSSRFYQDAIEVYKATKALTEEQKEIANFWDCNPYKMNVNGHVMFATKKISPGGHWINITRLACKKVDADFVRSAEAYACIAITLADGFISCWDEKYRSNVIRPETYINQYIDGDWLPLLQTPPFPEYTSGHSVISAASALMLTKMFGDQFDFADSTELEFGLPVRHFRSFNDAAKEAALSRFYGGIHYMPSINNGLAEGNQLGRFISQKIRTRKEAMASNDSSN